MFGCAVLDNQIATNSVNVLHAECNPQRHTFNTGNQKPGDHPNFRKNALGLKRPFSELSESSGVFSEQLSELEIPFSEYDIPFSEWPLTTWSTRNPQFSEQLSERFPELPRTHPKDFICPCILGAFFQELGWSPRTRGKFPSPCITLHTVVLVRQAEKTGGVGPMCEGHDQRIGIARAWGSALHKHRGRHCAGMGHGAAQSEGSALHKFCHIHKTKGFAEIQA